MADQLLGVFLSTLPLAALVLVATVLIRELPLRETAHADESPAEEAGHELLDAMAQSAPAPVRVG